MARITAPLRITQFLLSDVPGDAPEAVAGGLAVADPVPFDDALTLIRDHKLDRLDFVIPHLNSISNGNVAGPVRPERPNFESGYNTGS